MAITQDRMLKLLAAAEDFDQALRGAREIVDKELKNEAEGRVSAKEALQNIDLLFSRAYLLERPEESFAALVREKTHFSKARIRANAREAERMAQRRAKGFLKGEER